MTGQGMSVRASVSRSPGRRPRPTRPPTSGCIAVCNGLARNVWNDSCNASFTAGYNGNLYESGTEKSSIGVFHPKDVVKCILDMTARTLSFSVNGKEPVRCASSRAKCSALLALTTVSQILAFSNLPSEVCPAVNFYSSSRQATLRCEKVAGNTSSQSVVKFSAQVLKEMTTMSAEELKAVDKDPGKLRQINKRLLDVRKKFRDSGGFEKAFNVASVDKTITEVVLQVLREPDIVARLRRRGADEGMSLKDLLVRMYETEMLKDASIGACTFHPDVLSDLLFMASGRSDKERECGFQFLSLPCCIAVKDNRASLLRLHLMRHVVSWFEHPTDGARLFGLRLVQSGAQDAEFCEALVESGSAIKALFRLLAKAFKDGFTEGIVAATAVIGVLCANPKFVAKMFLRDVAGLSVLLGGLAAPSVAASKTFVFDPACCSSVTLSDENTVVKSTGSGAYAYATKGFTKGVHTVRFKCVEDTRGDEYTCYGLGVWPVHYVERV